MKKRKLALAIASAASLSLAGCGGGGSGAVNTSDSGSDSGSGSGSGSGSSSQSYSVTAVDGYLERAEVYVDADASGTLDESEINAGPVGLTDESGSVELGADYRDDQLLVRAVAGQTLDSDSGIVQSTFVMSGAAGATIITPFTHLANLTGSSLADLASTLGVDESLVSGDFVALKDDPALGSEAAIIHAVARFVVTELKQGLVSEDAISSALADAKTQIEAAVANGADPDHVEVELDDSGSGGIVSAPATKLAFKADFLRSEESWTAYQIEDNGENAQLYFRFGNANDENALCVNSEPMSYLNSPQIEPLDASCSTTQTFSVNDAGQLVVDDGGESGVFDMLYRYSDERESSGLLGGTVTYKMFLMAHSNGQLFWVDNNSELRDPGNYLGAEDVTRFSMKDRDLTAGAISADFIRGEFDQTGTWEHPFYGSLNAGTVDYTVFEDNGESRTLLNWEITPLCDLIGDFCELDEPMTRLELADGDMPDQAFLPYRQAGLLELAWVMTGEQGASDGGSEVPPEEEPTPPTDGPTEPPEEDPILPPIPGIDPLMQEGGSSSTQQALIGPEESQSSHENLFLSSESRELIGRLYAEFEARDATSGSSLMIIQP